jgi:hypothetical protein
MTHLGELGLRADVTADDAGAELDSFDWFGETFTIAARLSALNLLRMAWESRQSDDAGRRADMARKQGRTGQAAELTAEADRNEMAAMWEFLQATLGPGEWERFVEVSNLAAADDEALSGLIQQVIGVITDRPTRRPSASAGGSSTNTAGQLVRSHVLSDHDRQVAELFFAGSAS